MSKFKLIRQTTKTECGLACISMVANYYGFQQPISYYREKFNIGRDGVSLKGIAKILDDINLNVDAIKINNFDKFDFEKGIYIIHLKSAHFIVLKKLNRHKCLILDPAKGKIKVDKSQLKDIASGLCLKIEKKDNFSKSKNNLNEFRHIIPVVKNSIFLIIGVIITSALVYIVSLMIPFLLKNIINDLVYNKSLNFNSIYLYAILIVITFYFISSIRNKIMVKLQSDLYNKISLKSICHLFKIKYSFYDNRTDGDIIYRLGFLNQIQSAISGVFIQLLVSFSGVIAVLIYLSTQYKTLLPILVLILILSSGIFLFFNRIILEMRKKELKSKEDVESCITEIVKGMYQIKCLHLENHFINSYKVHFTNFIKTFKYTDSNSKRLNLILNVVFTFTPFFFLIFLIQQSSLVSVGELFALYTLLTTIFSQCLVIVSNISEIILLKASVFYINDLLDEKEIKAIRNNKKIEKFESLSINNMSFRYSDTSLNVLNDININLTKGKCIAIVGASGSGKTTLLKLITKLYEPSNGNITINGNDLKCISNDTYLNIISMVTQYPVMFNKTIRNNIVLDNKDISDEEIIKALKIANIWEEIEKMPLGLDTFISGQGGNLSGGQIQRIAIARAIVNKPELLIMDESTSSLDSINEQKIYINLRKENITQLIVSHRLSTVANADYIYVLSNGRIVEQGDHLKLLGFNGLYANMFNEQIS